MLSNILIFQIIYHILLALILTFFLEYFIIVKILNIPIKLFIFTNILTNVTANIIIIIYDLIVAYCDLPSYLTSNRFIIVVILECIVFAVESMIFLSCYKYKKVLKVVAFTLFANFLSAYVGSNIIKLI